MFNYLVNFFNQAPFTLKLTTVVVLVALLWQFWPIVIGLILLRATTGIEAKQARYATYLLLVVGIFLGQWMRFGLSLDQLLNLLLPDQQPEDATPLVLSEQNQDWYEVFEVIDGDTIKIQSNETTQSIRLIGIDAPELSRGRTTPDCFAVEAQQALNQKIKHTFVRLEIDESQSEVDRYQRLLRYVFDKDGTNINQWLIAQGYAFEYTYNLPYLYQSEFIEAEKSAQVNQLGLWSLENCNYSTTMTITPTIGDLSNGLTPTVSPITTCDCTANTYDCQDFAAQSDAQACFEFCGGIKNDIHPLDTNQDGRACEFLP